MVQDLQGMATNLNDEMKTSSDPNHFVEPRQFYFSVIINTADKQWKVRHNNYYYAEQQQHLQMEMGIPV